MNVSYVNSLHANLIVKLTEACWSLKPNSTSSSYGDDDTKKNMLQNSKCLEYLSMTADATNKPIIFSIGRIKVTWL